MIRETITEATRMNLENIIIESDSQVTLSITDKTGALKQVYNVDGDIKNISSSIKDISFFSYSRSTNTLTDKLMKKVHDTLCNIM